MPQEGQNRVPADPEGEPELLVPRSQMDQELADRIDQGRHLTDSAARGVSERTLFETWDRYNEKLLARRFSTSQIVDRYRYPSLPDAGRAFDGAFLLVAIPEKLHRLESIRQELDLYESQVPVPANAVDQSPLGNKIFLVHGHDGNT
jgi:hypothetical protein